MFDVLVADSTLRSDPAAWPRTVVCGVDGSSAAMEADVLVLGSHDIETTRGVSLGRVATPLLSTARCSILIARRPPDRPLFGVIELASGGSSVATLIAAHLAAEHGSELRTHPPGTVALGSGLVVTGDGAEAARIAREARCSVLIVRAGSDPGCRRSGSRPRRGTSTSPRRR